MRAAFIGLSLALGCAVGASAQLSNAPDPKTPIYFLVDTSGSMQGQNKDDAELLLRALSLPQDQPVSVTYFGRKPATPGANLCFEKMEVPNPVPRGRDFSPTLTGLGGNDDQTAITNAIDEVLGKIRGPGKIIVITDGQEGCNRHFADIRLRYPDAEIEVRQVGDSPNAELQKLQERPPPKPVVTPAPAPGKVDVHVALDSEKPNAWEKAEWPARYFWLLPYLFLAVAAGYFGSSFGNTARRYNDEITTLQNQRRRADDHFAKNGTRLAEKWPEFLGESDAAQGGDSARKTSLSLLLLSCAAGIPLITLNGATWAWSIAVPLFAPVAILWLLFVAPRMTPKLRVIKALPMGWGKRIGIALSAILLSAAYYFVGGDHARGAAWVVLSSNFSAALAIVASAPLLFAGSQLGELDRAKSSYKNTWDHGQDEEHRQEMVETRTKQDERDRILSSLVNWMFPPSTTTRIRDKKLQKDKDAIKKYLASLAHRVADLAKNTNDNSKLSTLQQTGDLVGAIRAVVEIPELKLPENIRAALFQIPDAYDSRNDSKIAQALSEAAKIIRT